MCAGKEGGNQGRKVTKNEKERARGKGSGRERERGEKERRERERETGADRWRETVTP